MNLSIVLRSYSNPETLVAPARHILQRIDPDLAMYEVRTMTEQLERALWARRAYSWLFGLFSLVALILAVAGIYGVIYYAVTQRTQEIGIRMAMGATLREVLANILRSGMTLVAAGTVVGLTVTLAAADLLDKLLYGVSAHDPLLYSLVVLTVTAVALLANAIPARRAARLDPISTLQTE
jgi:ABC-type antimicrobial peptide transport system permease subunit